MRCPTGPRCEPVTYCWLFTTYHSSLSLGNSASHLGISESGGLGLIIGSDTRQLGLERYRCCNMIACNMQLFPSCLSRMSSIMACENIYSVGRSLVICHDSHSALLYKLLYSTTWVEFRKTWQMRSVFWVCSSSRRTAQLVSVRFLDCLSGAAGGIILYNNGIVKRNLIMSAVPD